MKLGICGMEGYASFEMRGKPLLEEFECEFLPADRPVGKHFDTILLVKRNINRGPSFPPDLRSCCDKLIADPLDWWLSRTRRRPQNLWQSFYNQLQPDVVIATSPVAVSMMQGGFPEGVDIRMIQHASDPAITSDWYDESGPIAYAGLRCYVEGLQNVIYRACRKVGRSFKVSHQFRSHEILRGAALTIAVRSRVYCSPYIGTSKPLVKLANASAATMPAVCSGLAAEKDLYPDAFAVTSNEVENADFLAERLNAALKGPPPGPVFTQSQYVAEMKSLLFDERN